MDSTTAPSPPSELPNSTHFDADPADFNPVAWANAALSSSPSSQIPSLLDLLQDAIRDAHVTLDTSLKSALSAVPWIVRETDKVRQRANLLRAGVDGVGQRVEGVETGVASSVTTIADADTVVRRVQHASELLAQAVEAERLLARLDALLASSAADGSDLVSAADVVSQLRATLAPLKPISELADRFAQLDAADRKLEALAAPQLKKALESRNTQAAINARIVFDHAGRDNAFQTQYVALRGQQVAALWSSAWEAKEAVSSADEKASPAGVAGDLAGVGAEATLVGFYAALYDLVHAEAEWLAVAFPDLKDELLPALLCEAVGGLKNPVPVSNVFVPSSAPDDADIVRSVGERLFRVALTSVTAAGRIAQLLLRADYAEAPQGEESEKVKILVIAIVDAMTAILGPFRAFWNSLNQVAIRQARTTTRAISLPNVKLLTTSSDAPPNSADRPSTNTSRPVLRPALGELANDVETCTTEALAILDACLTTVLDRTKGIGVSSMKQVATTIASVLSDQLLHLLRLPARRSGSSEDEWAKISGALRLLIATSTLKRMWDARKESLFAVAVGAATPVLESASIVQDSPAKRVEQFLSHVKQGSLQEGAVVWELVRDPKLTPKVVGEFESMDSAADFQTFVDAVHREVYECMFAGAKDRFSSFKSRDFWGTDGADGEGSMLGFSSSPLGYATEVADYLMTVPQQLEPFVPDEEDAKHAMPRSEFAFSNNGPPRRGRGHDPRRSQIADGSHGQVDAQEAEGTDDMKSPSFAGMWISLLAIGTMEFYVERICSIPKMSSAGTRQLATDADYICNVIASLGVAPTPEMALVCRLLECRPDPASFKEAAEGYNSAEQRKLSRKVASIRGINVSI